MSALSNIRWEHFIAGISGGVVSTVALHPLDLVKVRFQVNEGRSTVSNRPQYTGIFDALVKIGKQGGVKGLYQGVTPNVYGAGSAWGLYFLFYNEVKQVMRDRSDGAEVLGPGKHMSAAGCAGVLTLAITNPLWVAKTRLCLQYDVSPTPVRTVYYKGTLDCITQVYKADGIRGLYKGFVPGLFGVTHGAIQFMCYEELKKLYNEYRQVPYSTNFNTVEYLSFAAISKMISATVTYPYQVLRSRLQDQHRVYSGVIDVASQTWRLEGWQGFYKGIWPHVLRVTPVCAITFVVYEKMLDVLGARQPRAKQ